MDIKVKKLYDVSQVVVPEEMTKWKVTDTQVEEQLEVLRRLTAVETEAETVEKGDCVCCSCSAGALKGRTVLIYPGMNLPGAEAAEEAVLSAKPGSEFTVELNGEAVLKVEKIVHRVPAEISDDLAKAQGIEGVETLDDYRAWYRKTTGETQRAQVLQQIKNYILDEVAKYSEFEYDEAEVNGWIEEQMQMQLAFEAEQTGMPAEMSEEERQGMSEFIFLNMTRVTVMEQICENHGFTFTADMFVDEVKSLIGDMPGMEDMVQEYAESYAGNAYMEKVLELLDEQAQSCLEVE